MRPRDGHDQRLLSSELDIDPEPRRLRWLYDTFDNCVAIASFSGACEVADDREPVHGRTHRRRPAGRRDRPASAVLSLFLCAGGAARRRAGDGAPLWRPRRRPRPLGAAVRSARRDDADQPSVDDDDLRHQGRIFLRTARGVRGAIAAPYAGAASRFLPRLCGPDDGGGARAWRRRAIRLRLCIRPERGGRAGPIGGRGDSCVVPDLPARRRLDRVRPHQWPGRRQGPHPRRGRARSCPGSAADGRLFRRLRRRTWHGGYRRSYAAKSGRRATLARA